MDGNDGADSEETVVDADYEEVKEEGRWRRR